MEEKQIGLFIRDRRLAMGLTQQQLADKLGITDKAVSKWERCVSCPDITLLRELSGALEVSVSELLAGELESKPSLVPQEVEDVVLDTVSYAETARRKNSGWRFWTFVALTAGCLVAALVLGIIYCAVGFDVKPDVLLAIKCVGFGWAVCYPLLRSQRRPIRDFLLLLSLAIVPFLLQFPGDFWHWALWIVLFADIYLWAVYFICRKLLHTRVWLAAGWTFLLGAVLSFGIYAILSSRGIDGNLIGAVITAITAGVCFLIDFALRRQRE